MEAVRGRQGTQRRGKQDAGMGTGRKEERLTTRTRSDAKRASNEEVGRDRKGQPCKEGQQTCRNVVAKRGRTYTWVAQLQVVRVISNLSPLGPKVYPNRVRRDLSCALTTFPLF